MSFNIQQLFRLGASFASVMIVQQLIILALFLGAAFYVGRRLWLSFFAKSEGACPKGCGGACGTINVDALQRTIEKAQKQPAI